MRLLPAREQQTQDHGIVSREPQPARLPLPDTDYDAVSTAHLRIIRQSRDRRTLKMATQGCTWRIGEGKAK